MLGDVQVFPFGAEHKPREEKRTVVPRCSLGALNPAVFTVGRRVNGDRRLFEGLGRGFSVIEVGPFRLMLFSS